MKYYVITDNRGYVLSITRTGTVKDYVELDLDKYDLTEGRIHAYTLGYNALVFDEKEYQRILDSKQQAENQLEISDLKQKLNETDYIMARWGEELISLENPLTWVSDVIKINIKYSKEYKETLANRKSWRKRIEELGG